MLCSFTTALLESISLTVTLDVISLSILPNLLFSWVRKPILDTYPSSQWCFTATKPGAKHSLSNSALWGASELYTGVAVVGPGLRSAEPGHGG